VPGIVGLVTRTPRERAERELRRMVDALCHESFYETGTWIDASLGLYVGWCARKNSFCDPMPLRSERGDVVMVFSGEEFAAPGTARRLKEQGHLLDVQGAEYLVHLYEEDPSFPAGLNGRFHGLLADRTRRTAMLFNDRYGMHRVYYHESKDGFYFAAEAKAILAVRPELRAIEPRGLGELVSCGCVLENRTLFDGISVLPGAAMWVLRDGTAERKATYFQPREWESQPELEPEVYYREVRDVFSRNLPRYFAGREQIGISLTGGLDTRMIMAHAHPVPESLPCYTYAGMFRDSQDVRVARAVAGVCGQSHHVIRLGEEFLARFPRYAERTVYLTDGCAEVSDSPNLYVNESARQIAPVRMTGNYGGEVLRRVRAFKPVEPFSGPFTGDFLSSVRQAEGTYAELLRSHPLSFAVFQQAPWFHYGPLALEQTQVSSRSPYLDNDLVRTVFRAPQSASADSELCLRLIADANPRLRQIRTDRGLGGRGLSALALRTLREFQFKAEYAYDYGMPHWLVAIDRLLAPLRPEHLFLGRHKFSHFRLWYRDALSDYVRDVLLDPSTLSLPHVERRGVEAVVSGHLGGHRNYTAEIHKLLTVALVHRLFTRGSTEGKAFPEIVSTQSHTQATHPIQ
jgi:asparagine synthase (glutamine-hydrolysing)